MRRRWASDQHISAAREVFRRYFLINCGRMMSGDWSRPPDQLARDYINAGGRP